MRDTFHRPSRLIQSGTEMPATIVTYDFEDLPRHFVDLIDEYAGRDRTASIIGASSGTIDNIRRGRRKEVGVKLYSKVRAAFLRVLEERRRRIDAEITLALQSGMGAGDDALIGAAASLRKIEAVLNEAAR